MFVNFIIEKCLQEIFYEDVIDNLLKKKQIFY